MEVQDKNSFSEWYKKRFNSMVVPPPAGVWDNISRELDVNEVWNKVDSRLHNNERRKAFIRRTAYVSLLLLIFFSGGIAVFKSNTDSRNENLISEKGSNPLHADISLNNNLKSGEIVSQSKGAIINSFPKASNKKALFKKRTLENNLLNNDIFPASQVNSTTNSRDKNLFFQIEPSDNKVKANNAEKFNSVSIPTTYVTDPFLNSFEEYMMIPVSASPVVNSSSPPDVENDFHGFYSGMTFSYNNIWLLNHLTFDGLKANSLSDTKIDFGDAYGISAGYNFNIHFGGELNWHIKSQSGQSFSSYDEGKYEVRNIRFDMSVIDLLFKYRKQSYSKWLNMPVSGNILLGSNLGFIKRDKSVLPTEDNDDDIDITENLNSHLEHTSYGLSIGYEYEVMAFHRILLSSSFIGNIGLNNIFTGNGYVPESFNRTRTASFGFNLSAKYLIK